MQWATPTTGRKHQQQYRNRVNNEEQTAPTTTTNMSTIRWSGQTKLWRNSSLLKMQLAIGVPLDACVHSTRFSTSFVCWAWGNATVACSGQGIPLENKDLRRWMNKKQHLFLLSQRRWTSPFLRRVYCFSLSHIRHFSWISILGTIKWIDFFVARIFGQRNWSRQSLNNSWDGTPMWSLCRSHCHFGVGRLPRTSFSQNLNNGTYTKRGLGIV